MKSNSLFLHCLNGFILVRSRKKDQAEVHEDLVASLILWRDWRPEELKKHLRQSSAWRLVSEGWISTRARERWDKKLLENYLPLTFRGKWEALKKRRKTSQPQLNERQQWEKEPGAGFPPLPVHLQRPTVQMDLSGSNFFSGWKGNFWRKWRQPLIIVWLPRSPVLDEVLSGWKAEATNATDPEYEVGNFSIDNVFWTICLQVLRVDGVETEGSIVVDPEISFNKWAVCCYCPSGKLSLCRSSLKKIKRARAKRRLGPEPPTSPSKVCLLTLFF